MKQQGFSVSGMSCAACVARVENVVSKLPGVRNVRVNLISRSMSVCFDEDKTSTAKIITAVEKAGYKAGTGNITPTVQNEETHSRHRLILSLVFLIPLLLLHQLQPHSNLLQFLILLPILWLNRRYFISGTRATLHRSPNMDTLISMGAAAGILYSIADMLFLNTGHSYIDAAAMILTLVSCGKWLESRATESAGDAVGKLRELLPQTATVRRGSEQYTIDAAEVIPGDTLIIAEGSRIPADAIVTEGVSHIDESALTGESMPARKTPGSRIYAGTINGNGALLATAAGTRDESAISNIIRLVTDASLTKAPIARLADRISAFFVPAIVLISLSVLCIWLLCGAPLSFALGCAIAVLVVSCPCALGLATPVAIVAATGKGAENGILFRSSSAIETTGRLTSIILDKTGTLTLGKPAVTGVYPHHGVSEHQLLQLACSLEHTGTHPLAQAIRSSAAGFTAEPVSHFQYTPGKGITALINNTPCMAGNICHMKESGVLTPGNLPQSPENTTPVYFACGTRYMGMIQISDPIKPGAADAVADMKKLGMQLLMMSGDRPESVAWLAAQAGIGEYYAAATPEAKESKVRELRAQGHCVAMLGDGINDAPALARADAGIAIGAGTDVAIDSADIILVRSELQDAVAALRLCRAAMRTIRQNLFWAFFYNILAIPLAAGAFYPLLGWQLTPAVAATAMSCSSLIVVCNALRLRRLNLSTPTRNTMNTTTIYVAGMMCPHCERHVVQALSTISGITDVKADHKTGTVTLQTASAPDPAGIEAAIRNAGYEFRGVC